MLKIGIYGFGNIGRAVEKIAAEFGNTEVAAIFTKSDIAQITPLDKKTKVCSVFDVLRFKDIVDVMILCTDSIGETPRAALSLVRDFNIIDCFDSTEDFSTHLLKLDTVAREYEHIALIAAGHNPGIMSLAKFFGSVLFPGKVDCSLVCEGYSSGGTNALKKIAGVKNAAQFNVPADSGFKKVCYIEKENSAEKDDIIFTVRNMPSYFKDFETEIIFTDSTEIERLKKTTAVLEKTVTDGTEGLCFELKSGSESELTARILIAYATAVDKLNSRGHRGCRTVFDIAPADIAGAGYIELLNKFL